MKPAHTAHRSRAGSAPRRKRDRRRAVLAYRHRKRDQAFHQMLQGAAYGIGSGAVSLLVLWVQTRY